MNLYQKLNKIKEEVGGFYKDVSKQGITYKYVSGSQILEKVNPLMCKLGIVLVPKTTLHRGWEKHEYKTKNGNEKLDFIVDGELSYLLINTEDPTDQLEIKWQYYGQQDEISKAYGSALTYAERYLLLKLLGLPTDEDDPDGKPSEGYQGKSQYPPKQDKPTYTDVKPKQDNYAKPQEKSVVEPSKGVEQAKPVEQPKQQEFSDPKVAQMVAVQETRQVYVEVFVPIIRDKMLAAQRSEEEIKLAIKSWFPRFMNEVLKFNIKDGAIVGMELSKAPRKEYIKGNTVVVADAKTIEQFGKFVDDELSDEPF